MNQIIVISTKDDAHIPLVQQHIPQKLLVVDPITLLTNKVASFAVDMSSRVNVIWNETDISTCKSVWFRKPKFAKLADYPVHDTHREFTAKAQLGFFSMLYGILDQALWVSDRHAIHRAENKMLQLVTAKESGLCIPKTLITGSANAATNFRRETGDIVTKPIQIVLHGEPGKKSGFFTTLIRANDELDLRGLSIAPAIFQEAITDKLDIRVTIVGEQIFSIAIESPQGSSPDWRESEVNCSVHHLPRSIGKKCVSVLKKLGLEYGAFDFALDLKSGKYWFLEVNPNGQWGFVELETGLPISKAFADLLN